MNRRSRRPLSVFLFVLLAASGCGRGCGEGPGGSRGAGPGTAPGPRRVLLIGLDAADERMIGPLAEAGRLPFLARLRAGGTTGALRSHEPLLSPILWTSIATGTSPERHGVLDFVEIAPGGRAAPVGSAAREVATVWETLGRAGVRVGVVGWLATHPATPVNGWLVTDRFTIHPFDPPASPLPSDLRGTTWPAELAGRIAALRVRPEDLSAEELRADFGPEAVEGIGAVGRGGGRAAPEGLTGPDERALRVISSTTRTHAAVAGLLLEEMRPSFLAVYFDGLDRLLHLFADASPPPLPGTSPARARRFARVGEAFLESLDRTLERLVSSAGEPVTVLIVSDHGWRSGADRPALDPRREGPFAAEWHHPEGIVIAAGAGVRAGERCEGADLYDIAPTVLAIYGLPPASGFRGRVLGELFRDGFLPPSGDPVELQRPERGAGAPAEGGEAGREERERAAVENLRGLGYIGGGRKGEPLAHDRRRFNLATVFLDEGRFREAAELCERFLEDRPGDYEALFNLGFARRRLGEGEAARRAYRSAAEARPSTKAPWMAIAEMEMEQRRWPEARAALERARAVEPASAAVWNALGVVASESGRPDEGARLFEKAIELSPGAPSGYLNLSRLLEAAGHRDAAVEIVRRGLLAAPQEPRLRARLAELSAGGGGNEGPSGTAGSR